MKDKAGVALWLRAKDRIQSLSDDDGRQTLLNRVADLSSAVFGEMCLVQSAGLQALLKLEYSKEQLSDITTAEVFNLQESTAPANSQFVRGMLYCLCIDNHIFMVKTQSITANHFSKYIEWLLRSQSVITTDQAFSIQAEFDRSQVAGDIGEIKSFKVSGNAASRVVVADGTRPRSTVATAKRVADRMVQFAQAVPVVKSLLGDAKAESLIDSLGPEEYLSVDATIKIQGRRTAKSKEELGKIASELADITDGKVQVEGKDGKLSDEDAILRTRMPFEAVREGSNFLEFDNVADQLQEVYTRYVRDQKIKP